MADDNYNSETIFAQDIKHGNHNVPNGLPNTNGNAGGMIGGNIDSQVGFGQNIEIGTENLNSIVSMESAFDGNVFEKLFDGNLSIFGLTKSESFAIKSLGTLTALNSLSLVKQFKADLKQNMSVSSKGMEQG